MDKCYVCDTTDSVAKYEIANGTFNFCKFHVTYLSYDLSLPINVNYAHVGYAKIFLI